MDNEEQYVQAMEKFGDNLVSREEAKVGSAFVRFAVFTKELSALFKNLVSVEVSQHARFLRQNSLNPHAHPVSRCRT